MRERNMPATATMETAHGLQEAPPKVEEKPEWWASPATLGLMGFGTTTILAGLNDGGWIQWGALLSMAIFFGGSAQVIAGVVALRKGNMFAGTAFTGYGMFWLAFNNEVVNYVFAKGPTGPYDIAAFTFVWFLFTFAFLLCAPKHGIGITAVFLFLTIAFLLLTWQWWEAGQAVVLSKGTFEGIGAEIILTGLTAVFVGYADLINWNYGRKIVPV